MAVEWRPCRENRQYVYRKNASKTPEGAEEALAKGQRSRFVLPILLRLVRGTAAAWRRFRENLQ